MVCDRAKVTGRLECLADRIHPILSGALACTQWECDLGLAAVHSALPNTPGQLAVLELLRVRWAVVLLVMAYAYGIANWQRNLPSWS